MTMQCQWFDEIAGVADWRFKEFKDLHLTDTHVSTENIQATRAMNQLMTLHLHVKTQDVTTLVTKADRILSHFSVCVGRMNDSTTAHAKTSTSILTAQGCPQEFRKMSSYTIKMNNC